MRQQFATHPELADVRIGRLSRCRSRVPARRSQAREPPVDLVRLFGGMAVGLLDQVLGSLLGAGQCSSGTRQQGSSTMSPIVKSVLLLLAAQAFEHYTGPHPQQGNWDAPDSPAAS